MNTKNARPSSKKLILDVAVSLAVERGLREISREAIAKIADVAEATVSFHFGTMSKLRRAVIMHAFENEILPILADARVDRELNTRMSAELKKKVAAYIAR
jgi:AcrR family transcriptional regulator